MFRVALRPKNLGLLALMVAATLVCGMLANWQWHRANESRAIRQEASVSAPVELGTIMNLGDGVTNAIQGRLVSVTGTFDPSQQALSPGRTIDGESAAIVVTNFHIMSGHLKGSSIPIARGFLPEAEAMRPGAVIPAPPSGEVTIVVRLEASESASDALQDQGGAPLPVVSTISSMYLVNVWGGPMLAAYGSVTGPAAASMQTAASSDGAAAAGEASAPKTWNGLGVLPAAQSAFSSGINLQNFGYMLQWLVFGVFFLYIWWRTVRMQYLDELKERRLHLEALAGARDGGPQDSPALAASSQGMDSHEAGLHAAAPHGTDSHETDPHDTEVQESDQQESDQQESDQQESPHNTKEKP